MARRVSASDLTIVYCECAPTDRLPDGTLSEWYATPRDAALAVKRHVLAEDMYWLVHYTPDWCDPERNVVALRDTHVVSVVIDGMRYGPGPPEPE